MTTVEIDPASEQLRVLIDRIATGEMITLTEQGRPVAQIVPISPPTIVDRADVARVAREMLAYRAEQKRTLGTLTVREMIEEGRRF